MLTSGIYYVSQTVNGVESARTSVSVTVNQSRDFTCDTTTPVITTVFHHGTHAFISWTLPPDASSNTVYWTPSGDNFSDEVGHTTDASSSIVLEGLPISIISKLDINKKYKFKVSAKTPSVTLYSCVVDEMQIANIGAALSSIIGSTTGYVTPGQQIFIDGLIDIMIDAVDSYAALEEMRKIIDISNKPNLYAYMESRTIARISVNGASHTVNDINGIKVHLNGKISEDMIQTLLNGPVNTIAPLWQIQEFGHQTIPYPHIQLVPHMTNVIYTIHGIETKFYLDISRNATSNDVVKLLLTHSAANTITDITATSNTIGFPRILLPQVPLTSGSNFIIEWAVGEQLTVNIPVLADMIFNNTTSVPCFVAGTRIMTANGYRAVDKLTDEDRIVTSDGRILPFKLYTTVVNCTTAETAPYKISKGAFGRNSPPHNITLSPKHAIQSSESVWQIPKYAVKQFAGIKQVRVGETVQYYHIEMPNFFTDNIIANGSIVESYAAKQITGVVHIYNLSSVVNGFTRISASEGMKYTIKSTKH